MKILNLTDNNFPTNRPIINIFWNKEFDKERNSISWIMDSSISSSKIVKIKNSNPNVFLFNRNSFSRSKFFSLFLYLVARYNFIKKFIKRNKTDLVNVHDSVFDCFLMILLSKKLQIKFALTYTAPFIQLKKHAMSNASFLDKFPKCLSFLFYKLIFTYSFHKCNILHPISSSLSNKLVKNHSLNSDKVVPISESANNSFLNFDYNGIELPNSILYLGDLRSYRNIPFLLDCFGKVSNVVKNLKLYLIGSSPNVSDYEIIKKRVKELGIEKKVLIKKELSYDNLKYVIPKFTLGLSPIPPHDFLLDSTPTKVIDYLSLGIPVVANKEIKDQHKILLDSGGGLSVSYSKKEFSEAILEIINNNALWKVKAKKAKLWLSEERNFSTLSKTVEQKYEDFLK